MTCANCHRETDKLAYNTRWCGCWRNCTHGICEQCDVWQDDTSGDEWEEVEE